MATPRLGRHQLDRTLAPRTPADGGATKRSAMDTVVLAISLLDGDGSHRPATRNDSHATQHWSQHADQTPAYRRQCDHFTITVYASRFRNKEFITPLIDLVYWLN